MTCYRGAEMLPVFCIYPLGILIWSRTLASALKFIDWDHSFLESASIACVQKQSFWTPRESIPDCSLAYHLLIRNYPLRLGRLIRSSDCLDVISSELLGSHDEIWLSSNHFFSRPITLLVSLSPMSEEYVNEESLWWGFWIRNIKGIPRCARNDIDWGVAFA